MRPEVGSSMWHRNEGVVIKKTENVRIMYN